MFGYLRLFSAVSFFAILIIAYVIGMYVRSLAADDLRTLAERGHAAIAQAYVQTLWDGNGEALQRAKNQSLTTPLTSSPLLDPLRQETEAYFSKLPVESIVLYAASGAPIAYWHAQPMEGAQAVATIDKLQKSPKRSVTTVMSDQPLQSGEQGTLVKSFLPIDAQGASGYIELTSDLTNEWKKLSLFQWLTTGGIVTVFMVLIWILVLTSKKAETIIARQHETNMELAAAAAAAQAENREKSQFLANISHELRTPLNAIIGFSEIIKNELMGQVDNQRYHDYVHDIHSSGVHLLSLINDILDFSKAEAGKLDLEIAEVNVSRQITNCLRLVSPRAESAGVQLVDALPKEQFAAMTDSKKFKQVLLNLLSNAVKFTPQGGEVRVTAWRNVEDDSVTFEIRDSGIGIAPKDLARAMSPFGQVDNSLSRKYEGTGLGLPLTKKFVELMGGKFNIESQQGVGTTVTFTLPRQFRDVGLVPVRFTQEA